MNLVKTAIQRPVFIFMVMMFLVVLGLLALKKLPVDLYPNVSYPILVVRTDFPGAAPEEVEALVTKQMEDALSTLPGLTTLRSVSRTGSAIILMEFAIDTDIRFQEVQVRGKIGNLKAYLPTTVTDPAIYRADPDDAPIMEIAVMSDKSAAEITDVADNVIARKLRQIEGVGSVDIMGGRTEEIAVDLHPEALDAWHINAKDVSLAVQKFNRNDAGGTIEGKDRTWIARSISQSLTTHDLGKIPVAKSDGGAPVFLRDVADITQGFADINRVVQFGEKGKLRPAVLIGVLKQSGENTVAISDKVQAALKEIAAGLPPDMNVKITRDNAELIRSNVADVYESLVIGAILTIIVVLCFLRSPRSTFTTGLSLPCSVITTFAIMAVAGFTINVMTLLSLSLAIGLLVDDAIVVRENIFRYLHKGELSARESAYEGTVQVGMAVIATTLTIVAVFLPVGFMGGVSGQFFKQFALTVVFAVVVSLWDAMTMAPMLSAYFANIPDTAMEWRSLGRVGHVVHKTLEKFEERFDALAEAYHRALAYLLPRSWIAAAILVGAIVVALAGFGLVKKSFLPAQLGQTFTVSVTGPIAIPLHRALVLGDKFEKRIAGVKGLANWTVSAGLTNSGNVDVSMMIRVADEYARSQESLGTIRQEVRKVLAGEPGCSIRISEPADPLAGSTGRFQPVAVMVNGDDIGELIKIARQVRTIMTETEGITDVGNLQDEGLPEVRYKVDAELAAHYGMNATHVADSLLTWIDGDTTNSLKVGDDQYPIRIRLKGGKNMTPADLLAQNIYVHAGGNRSDVAMPLGSIVKLEVGSGPTTINRENRQRIMRIGANLGKGAALGDVVKNLEKKLHELPLPKGYGAKMVGQNEQMDELYRNVIFALVLGSLFVYMILASLFESLLHPLAVMIAIPLAATGAVLALLVTDRAIDLYAGIGMILLAGIVAKNSILLVDFAIQKVREGEDPVSAIHASAPIRLRPILMTSVAIIFGMLPVALGVGSGGATRQALGIATIGGVLSSTLLTLFVVPGLYVELERLSVWSINFRKSHLGF